MKTVAALFAWCAFIAGCCDSGPLQSAQAKNSPTAANSREATVIFIQPGTLTPVTAKDFRNVTCAAPAPSESGGFAPLLIPLAGIAADGLVNMVSSMLTKAKSDRTGTWSASVGGVALLPNTDYCLALSRGIITDRGGPGTSALNPGLDAGNDLPYQMLELPRQVPTSFPW